MLNQDLRRVLAKAHWAIDMRRGKECRVCTGSGVCWRCAGTGQPQTDSNAKLRLFSGCVESDPVDDRPPPIGDPPGDDEQDEPWSDEEDEDDEDEDNEDQDDD